MATGVRPSDEARFVTRLANHQRLAVVLIPVLLLATVAVARAGLAPTSPNLAHLFGGAPSETVEQLTAGSADILAAALASGAGITFEIV